MGISNAIRRAFEGLARPASALLPVMQRSRAAESRVAASPPAVAPISAARMEVVFQACMLTPKDREDVLRFYEGQTDETMSDIRGSRCAFLSGLSGETREEADRWMVKQFDQFFSQGAAMHRACMGLRDKEGKLIGISFMTGVPGRPGVCRTWGLAIDDGCHGKGAGTALKRAQLEHASQHGYSVAQTVLDMSDMKCVGAAAQGGKEIAIVRLLKRVSREYGYEMVGPKDWDRESMVISMKLKSYQ